MILLSSLPDSWDTVVVPLSNSAPDGKVTLTMVRNSMMSEEIRRKEQGIHNSTQSSAVVTETRGRSKTKNSNDNRDKSRGRSKSRKKTYVCNYCGNKGHIEKFCRIKKREKSKERDEDKKNEKDTAAAALDGDVVIVCDNNCESLECQDTTWIIDSATSYHVSPRREFFITYTPIKEGIVRMGNTGVCKIDGIGDICLETSVGCKLFLRNVRHVPDIRLNLISTGVLDNEGYVTHFGEGKCKLTKGSMVIARAKKISTLYRMPAKLCKGEVNVIEDSSTQLWHMRLGHLSEKGLGIISKKKFLPITGTSLKTCAHCLSGKQHRVAFRSSPPKRRCHILDLVHTDVCSMDARTIGGANYFVTFIDDHSRKVWAFALKFKSQVLDVFKHFHASVERETGRRLKCVRADNGGEYRGPFEQYCREHGIRLEKTVPKTPQHNG